MGAWETGIAESLYGKLTLGYSDNLRVAGLAFPETHFLWSPLLSMESALTKHSRAIFYLNCTTLQ